MTAKQAFDAPKGSISLKRGPDHPLLPVLKKWANLQSRFAEQEFEGAFDHSEMANTSLLIAAAYQTKNWSGAAEVYVERTSQEGVVGNGRVDAYLANTQKGFFVEVKQLWVNVNGSSGPNLTKENIAKVAEAKGQIQSLSPKGSYTRRPEYRRLYGGFIIPVIPYGCPDRSLMQARALDIARNHFGLIAWSFPQIDEEHFEMEDQNAYRPGVVLGLNDDGWTT